MAGLLGRIAYALVTRRFGPRPRRMKLHAGLANGIKVGTVLALGRPTHCFLSNHEARATFRSFRQMAFLAGPLTSATRSRTGPNDLYGVGEVVEGRGRAEQRRWFHGSTKYADTAPSLAGGVRGMSSYAPRDTVDLGVYTGSRNVCRPQSVAAGRGTRMMTSTERDIDRITAGAGVEGSTEIFCNRELNMKQIKAIGFDMDYTLAQYYTVFDELAFEGAKQKLVLDLGYPSEVDGFHFDPEYFSRGLVIDVQRGNIIKMDRHRYIRVAFHGFTKLESDERKRVYLDGNQAQSFTGPKYVSMDTLFSLVDATLYAHLVELKDTRPDLLNDKTYEQLFRDVRRCVDLCHRDGVIKDRVAEEPGRYIIADPNLVPMMKRLRREGVQLFLLTNSLWDYTHVVMNFLCGKSKKEERTAEWLDLFDVAITGACKPGFLVEPFLSLFRVDTSSGCLSNTDGVTAPVDYFLQKGKVFQGGNWLHLHDMLNLSSGDQLLYVGDHMFADILRSKRTLGWRTCLIVPELAGEMASHRENRELRKAVNRLRTLQHDLDTRLDEVRLRVMDDGPESLAADELAKLEREQIWLKTLLRDENLRFHSKFHPDWGQLFKSGYQDSRFAIQVATYACIYTSKASNLSRVSTQRSFRPVRDVSAHDLILEAAEVRDSELDALKQRVLHAASEPSVDVDGGPETPERLDSARLT